MQHKIFVPTQLHPRGELHDSPFVKRRERERRIRYPLVYTPTVSRFGVSHSSPSATVANAKTANSRMKIEHVVAVRSSKTIQWKNVK